VAHAIAANNAGVPSATLFKRALKLAPDDGLLLLSRASALAAVGRVDEALAVVESRLERRPVWQQGHAAAARLRWMRGERSTFTATLEKAEQASPRDLSLWCLHIDTLIGVARYEALLALLPKARQAIGSQPVFDEAEAIAAAELGRTEEADRRFARLPELRGISVILHYARHLLRSGRVDEMVQWCDRTMGARMHPLLWPYLSVAWRLTSDKRWHWLEGDPNFIGVYDLDRIVPRLGRLRNSLRARHTTPHEPLHQSLRGGTQTEGNLFSLLDPEIRHLRRELLSAVEAHVATLPPPMPGHPLLIQKRAPIRFAGSWSVRLTDGGYHANHNHPTGWLSSSFYVALPERNADDAPDAGHLVLGEFDDLGIYLPSLRVIEPRPGRLVLFPSTMMHATRPFSAGERLTVAFDVAPV
jgi:hypothetical protein